VGEDDMDDQDFLKEVFSTVDNTFSLSFINNGKQVINYLDKLEDKHLPCLIVLDYNMPELTGAEILHELKKKSRYSSIPKVIWSTSGSEVYKQICFEAGANDYVIKPSNVSELVKVVQYMVSFC
jgi:CheY-like chemotaxis protein